jgi:hypothetical protein
VVVLNDRFWTHNWHWPNGGLGPLAACPLLR